MKDYFDFNIIDIGVNIGVYILSIVKVGCKVLVVEVLDRNM